jgi:hypothetical protein
MLIKGQDEGQHALCTGAVAPEKVAFFKHKQAGFVCLRMAISALREGSPGHSAQSLRNQSIILINNKGATLISSAKRKFQIRWETDLNHRRDITPPDT